MTIPTLPLNDGRRIPAIGLGTYGLREQEGVASLVSGLEAGYRLLDSAVNYRNEREIGEAVRASGLDREDVFVTTKLPGRHHGYDETKASLRESLDLLGLDRVDLYLIHWPNPSVGRYADSWRAMVELREEGLARSIGVSNFTAEHLDRIVAETGVAPAVNQIELHPAFPQREMREVDLRHGTVTESWSPLGKASGIRDKEVVVRIAEAHDVTASQVVLRWHVQLGALPIPKSGDAERQRQNIDVFGFELTDEEMSEITALESGRIGGDPDTHEEM